MRFPSRGLSLLIAVPLVVSLSACGSSGPGPAYPSAALEGDVSTVLSTLEEAYGPKALIVPVAWQRIQRRIEAIDLSSMDRERFCDVLGSALTEYGDPGLFVTLDAEQDVTRRCHAEDITGRPEGLPTEGVAGGENIASGEAVYAMRREGETTLIGIRHFAPRDDPGWEGLRVFDVQAPAILLDLRGARGTDPRALLERIWGITQGRQIGFPLRNVVRPESDVAEAARARAAELGRLPRRDTAVWGELVGPPRDSVPAQPKPAMSVLIDAGCEEACQLVARVLETWADATIVGTVSTNAPVSRDELGIVILPETGIALHFPTAAYVLNWALDRQGDAAWRTRPQPAPAADESLEGVLRALNYRASTRQRIEEHAESEASPCAEQPTYANRGALPEAQRGHIFGTYDEGVDQSVTVTMDLPMEAASAWLSACPGVTLGESSTEPDGSSFFHINHPSFAELSRILGHGATRSVTIHNQPEAR